jgi:hypothetical protein
MDQNKLKELKDLLESDFEKDLKAMTARDRLTIYLNLMEFFTPKLQRAGFQVDPDSEREIKITHHYGSDSNNEL